MTFSFIFSFNSANIVPYRKRKKGASIEMNEVSPDYNTWSSMPYSLQKVCGYYFYLPLGCVHKQWRVVRWSLWFKDLIPVNLKVLSNCGCNYKGSTFSSLILRPWLLVRPKSSSRPPAWKPDAQPTEPQVSWALNFTLTVGEIMMHLKNQHTSMNEVQLHQESGLYKYPVTQDFLFPQGTEKWLVHFVSQKLILEL